MKHLNTFICFLMHAQRYYFNYIINIKGLNVSGPSHGRIFFLVSPAGVEPFTLCLWCGNNSDEPREWHTNKIYIFLKETHHNLTHLFINQNKFCRQPNSEGTLLVESNYLRLKIKIINSKQTILHKLFSNTQHSNDARRWVWEYCSITLVKWFSTVISDV